MKPNSRDVLVCLNNYFKETENSLEKLQHELEVVKLERDMLKQMLREEKIMHVNDKCNVAYVTIYSKDNGEGIDTETCVGVFTRKSMAMQAIVDVCTKNSSVSQDSFTVGELTCGKPLSPNDVVNVKQCDVEAHCETSTTIIGIQCGAMEDNEDDNCYTVEYIVDKVYHIDA